MADSHSMRKGVILTLFTALTIGAVIFRWGSDLNGADEEREYVSLENSIIINGIRMESEVPPSETDDGSIILDDSFDNSFVQTVLPEQKNGTTKEKVNTTDSIMKGLKRSDQRWHLINYRIRKNDNLWSVARRFGVDHKLIIAINCIQNPDRLRRDKTIRIPTKNGIFHTIRKGETLSDISRKYSVSVESIKEQNNLRDSTIIINNKLFVPGARITHPSVQIARREEKTGTGVIYKTSGRLSLLWPLKGAITSGFGNRIDPFMGRKAFHCGIDISANTGTPVRAAMDGKVIFSGWKDGYGRMVIIRHKIGYITVYAHNSKNLVEVDELVDRGKLIAYSGNTGAVTGAHLHFELRKYLTPLNPLRFF